MIMIILMVHVLCKSRMYFVITSMLGDVLEVLRCFLDCNNMGTSDVVSQGRM